MKNSKFKVFRNNLYAMKTVWQISKNAVIHMSLNALSGYFVWLFFSIFFIRYLIGAIENEAPFGTIMVFIGICFVVFGSLFMYKSYSEAAITPYIGNRIYRTLYKRLYAKARNVELRCFEDAEFYNRYTMALDGAADKMTQSVFCFIRVVVGTIAAAAAFYSMYLIDTYSVLFVISPIIGNFLFGGMSSRIHAKRYEETTKYTRRAEYVNRVMYLAEYAKEIRCSGIHGLMMKRYRQSAEGTRAVADKYWKKHANVMWIKNTLTFALVFEGIMIYAAYRTMITKSMDLAELAVMFSAMVASSWILIGLFNDVVESLKNGQFIEYFRSFMEYEEEIPEDGGGIMPDETVRSIEFRNVSFEYKKDEPVIKSLSFTIEGGQTVALVGHNGAGKTTIIKLLFRLYDPTAGDILVNGVNIRDYNLKAYRRLFAAAFQDYKVMSMSVKENVLMGIECENELAENALKRAGIWDKIQTLSNGMETVLTKEFDKDGAVLSGGEVQKIIVARAFAQKAPVKVFDEPSSALDPIAEFEMYQSIMRESKGQTTLFISHRLSSVKDADMVFMLENGTVIERGTHSRLMSNGGAYCEMFTKQAQNYLAVEDYREGAAV